MSVNKQTDIGNPDNPEMATSTFGERLKECRLEAKLTQPQVAKRVGMSQTNLSELENDKYPTSSFTPALASLYHVEAIWLADGRGPKYRHPILPLPEDATICGVVRGYGGMIR